ncbi:MAG: Lipid carrier : UDP-N-acetylgalactosaminyltransferase [Anaerolineae bacterium]|jgi:glycosyltransferase involved in cell wall biosynthesis|nr:MAG: Lipid carrier : UDP-N-acetylgalactosaminyltransferase [Anaerolineae bacterium]
MEVNHSLLKGQRIALVANTDWYLWNYRLSLANHLRETGSEVYLISPKGAYSKALQAHGFKWIEWQLNRRSIFPIWEIYSLVKLHRLYRQIQPDIVHHFTVKPVLYGSFVSNLLGVSYIFNSITGLGYFFLRDTLAIKMIRNLILWSYSFVLRKPNVYVIFENQDDRSFFLERNLANSENTFIIEGVGVDIHQFTPSAEPEGTPIILYAGRFLWEKGLGELIEAARFLRGQFDFRLVLVGNPDTGNPGSISMNLIDEWVQEGIVEWWGWQDNMAEVYQKCHVVVLPSYREGIPTTLIEALAAQKPVIATDAPGCRDVVIPGVNGLLVPPRNPEALRDALALLLSNRDLRIDMGKAGREIAIDKFSKEVIDHKTIMLYHSILMSNKKDER